MEFNPECHAVTDASSERLKSNPLALYVRRPMDPASVIGTAAAAAQLAGLCKNLFSLFKTARPALEVHLKSIEELLAVSNLIIRRTPLHTREITDLVRSLIELLNTLDISSRASRNRLVAFWTLFWKGAGINEVFVSLETKKSTILLCIASVQSTLLQDIRDEVANMSNQLQDHSMSSEMIATAPLTSLHPAGEATPRRLLPAANERRTRDPGPGLPGKPARNEEEDTSGNSASEKANVVAEHVEMDTSEAQARQVVGFANGRLAGENERIFIRKAVMKGNGQMVVGFST